MKLSLTSISTTEDLGGFNALPRSPLSMLPDHLAPRFVTCYQYLTALLLITTCETAAIVRRAAAAGGLYGTTFLSLSLSLAFKTFSSQA
jgi:hypothetical protein